MNTLLLSVGGTGSTLLQRLITINYYLAGVRVQNTHDIVNKHLFLNQDKNVQRNGKAKEYQQTLPEIISVLKNSNPETALVSRLSKDHLELRNDNIDDTNEFLVFVKQFYGTKVTCIRENVFEFAMSLAIKQQSKVYNVFNEDHRKMVEKVNRVDEKYFLNQCEKYVKYHNWIDKNFPNNQQISYEHVLSKPDDVLHNVTGLKDTLVSYFGIPTSSLLRLESKKKLNTKEKKALSLYENLLSKLISQKIFNEMPKKNLSLHEKKNRIQNFDRCFKIFKQYTRKFDFINPSISTYDSWNQKHVDSMLQGSI
jgi:hypothetical protein